MFGGTRVRSRNQRRNRSKNVRRSRSKSGSRKRARRTRRRQSRGGAVDDGEGFTLNTFSTSDAYGGQRGEFLRHKIIGNTLVVRQSKVKEGKRLFEIDGNEATDARQTKIFADANTLVFQLVYNGQRLKVTNLYDNKEKAAAAKAKYGMIPAPKAINTDPTEQGGVLPPASKEDIEIIRYNLDQWFPYAVEVEIPKK